MADRVGQQLGNYRLTRLLGRGGFAEVYLGEHIDLLTMVAIKILHTRVAESDMAPFRQEARLLASLRHPQIVRVLDFGFSEETPYLVMDYAPNGTLRTRHARGTQLPVSTTVSYVKQLAEALQYAHDRKVIHRDIKPENMLIGENNEILLSDFGIALIAQSSHYQSTKDMAGTIAYMAPEQIEAHPRRESDQYSLGVVVYEWLSGTLPFHGSFTEIAIKHSITPPQPLRGHLPTLSPDVEHVILTALAKRPEERFASVSAFARALEQACQDILPIERSFPIGISSPVSAPPPHQPNHQHMPSLNRSVPIPLSATQTLLNSPRLATTTSKPKVSRRSVLIGTAGAVVIVAVGAGAFAILQQPPHGYVVAPPNQTATPQVPTATPFTYQGHSSPVRTVAWSPDGKQIASGSSDKTVQVWNASDGSHVFTYRGHSDYMDAVAWSPPDGKRIASSSRDKTVQVWNASDGSHVFTYRGHSDYADTVAWSPSDGNRMASGSFDKTVQVWNASDGSYVFTYRGHSDYIQTVAWSPDGKWIASGSNDKTVQVWNASDGSHIFTYRGHSDVVYAVAWSPDGKQIASGSRDDTVQVWNTSDGSHVFTYRGYSSDMNAVAWSPDGRRIAFGSSDNMVQVLNASDGSHVFTYKRHSNLVLAVAWSPDGKWIASGSNDNTVQVWQVG